MGSFFFLGGEFSFNNQAKTWIATKHKRAKKSLCRDARKMILQFVYYMLKNMLYYKLRECLYYLLIDCKKHISIRGCPLFNVVSVAQSLAN